ncbi:MAG TPA: aspartate kinase [Candidatus Limnocylindria bacterium]|nr:aspartate kinase [Candidatus Limnocylindria bacterium]
MTTVLKFGGTSVGSAEAIRRAVDIVKATEGPRVVVVSATAGTTDLLAEAAQAAARGDGEAANRTLTELGERHGAIARELGVHPGMSEVVSRTAALLNSVAVLHECTPRTLDAIWSYGERVAMRIVSAALAGAGVKAGECDATLFIVTDDSFGSASPDMARTRERSHARLGPMLALGMTPVVTGFIGATPDGIVTTLGRGGSDFSAAIVAASIGADRLLIYTDVSGVMSADPRIVADARPLAAISYAEASELSYFGAKVIHPRTVRPAVEAGIPVRILNTFAPEDPGTTVTGRTPADGSIVKATTSLGGLGLVTVQGAGMSGVPGFAAKVFDTTAAEGVSVLMISQSSSENSICFVVPQGSAERLRGALERTLARELGRHDVERVTVEAPVAIVAAVGEGMRGTPGVAARVFGALGRAKVNVIAIAQGSSELNISLAVADRDREAAVRAIHAEFHR